jgi:hypothetical protein
MFGVLRGKKTYITTLLTIVGAGASYFTGEATAVQAAQMVVTAILASTLRSGMR